MFSFTPPILDRDRVRELDRIAIEDLGIPGIVLMENAGRGATDVILREYPPGDRLSKAVVLCGAGNNGGDGYVVARHLSEAGVGVTVLESAALEELSSDAGIHRRMCVRLGLALVSTPDGASLTRQAGQLAAPQLFIDALLGTGCRGALREGAAALLTAAGDQVARWGASVVALDSPSGLDVDTGAADPSCLPADLTLTFAANKPALASGECRELTGPVEVVSIGLPREAYERLL
jgi:hydroxyethylthiazole kinase-like uncharacterized protein yjeF